MINYLIESISNLIHDPQFTFIITVLSTIFKFFLIGTLVYYGINKKSIRKPLSLLFLFLAIISFNDSVYLLRFMRYNILSIKDESHILNFTIRLGWILFFTQHQALFLFFKHLLNQKIKIKNNINFLFTVINIIMSLCFMFIAIKYYNVSSNSHNSLYIEIKAIQIAYILLIPLFIPLIKEISKAIKQKILPKILCKQLKALTLFIAIPYFVIEMVIMINKNSALGYSTLSINKYLLLNLSTALTTYLIYYCFKKIMGLRFLNFKSHVYVKDNFDFTKDFKFILQELSYITKEYQLVNLIKNFYFTAFGIEKKFTHFYLRNHDLISPDILDIIDSSTANNKKNVYNKIENFIAANNNLNNSIFKTIQDIKVIIKDEIEFTNFYKQSPELTSLINFMNEINADVFLPIFEKQNIIAYVIIDEDAHNSKLYSNIERDEMFILSSYLNNIINILKHNNIEALIKREKELEGELYVKHQQVNQYKESINTFFKNHGENKFGILFNKNKKITYANKEAQDLIGADLCEKENSVLRQKFIKICNKAQRYKTNQSEFIYNGKNKKLIVSAIPDNKQDNSTILIIHNPEISDVIKPYYHNLDDLSKWDSLLCLETTQSGKLINNLIPGNGQSLLNFKINLLNAALSKKAVLLTAHKHDILELAELLHYISLREKFYKLKLVEPEKDNDAALKIFGINYLFTLDNNKKNGILSQLSSKGTLFIQNIHLLSLNTQEKLAKYLIYGHYTQLKSDIKIYSNMRIICSTNANLKDLVNEGKFSKRLLNELKKTSIIMPSLVTLPNEELIKLTEGFTREILNKDNDTFKNLIELNNKEKYSLIDQKPTSLFKFKEDVQRMILNKSKKNKINTIEYDPAYNIADPNLAQAIRLGKNALKDSHMMAILWEKFKNQNKIAILLGVNRSSVNRRCKEYNLC